MKLFHLVRVAALGLSFAACGAAAGLVDNVSASASSLTDSGATLLGQVRLITGDFSAKNSSPECLALRGKVFSKRKAVQLSAEWGTVVQTDEFKAFKANEKQFYDAGCKPESATATKACAAQEAQLEKDASALGATAQWKTLDDNSDWADLQTEFSKARQIDCL